MEVPDVFHRSSSFYIAIHNHAINDELRIMEADDEGEVAYGGGTASSSKATTNTFIPDTTESTTTTTTMTPPTENGADSDPITTATNCYCCSRIFTPTLEANVAASLSRSPRVVRLKIFGFGFFFVAICSLVILCSDRGSLGHCAMTITACVLFTVAGATAVIGAFSLRVRYLRMCLAFSVAAAFYTLIWIMATQVILAVKKTRTTGEFPYLLAGLYFVAGIGAVLGVLSASYSTSLVKEIIMASERDNDGSDNFDFLSGFFSGSFVGNNPHAAGRSLAVAGARMALCDINPTTGNIESAI